MFDQKNLALASDVGKPTAKQSRKILNSSLTEPRILNAQIKTYQVPSIIFFIQNVNYNSSINLRWEVTRSEDGRAKEAREGEQERADSDVVLPSRKWKTTSKESRISLNFRVLLIIPGIS